MYINMGDSNLTGFPDIAEIWASRGDFEVQLKIYAV